MSAEHPQSSEPQTHAQSNPTIPPEAAEWNQVRAETLHMEYLKQAWTDIQTMSDEFDKNILTFSSAGLGLSIVFLKDIVPIPSATGLWLLFASWIAFGIAILVTIASFQVSIWAQKIHIENLRKYYIERRPEYLDPPNAVKSSLRLLTILSGLCFGLAVVGTITFAVENVREVKDMSFPLKVHGGRMPIGITPLDTNPVGITKGRAPVSMTPVPTSQGTPASPLAPAAPASVAPAPAAPPAQSDTK